MSNMLRRREVFTIVTPIPGFIPRQLAIDILHSHSEVITLNPLVLDHKPIKAPRDAASDEFYSTWYEITERIQYVPGLGKMGSGKISFNGCFHDMPWGLQTHIYAPMNIDLRNKYRIAGNQPGIEPPEQLEIGLADLGAPADGLYLREDIEIKCNVAMVSFVKTQLKAAGKEMVTRIIKKAELLDAGVLQAMIEDGKLKTINPADRSYTTAKSPQPSPTGLYQPPASPGLPYHVHRPQSVQYAPSPRPGSQGAAPSGYHHPHQQHQQQQQGGAYPSYNSSPSLQHQQLQHHHQGAQELAAADGPAMMPVEMPGDFYHPAQPSPHLQPPPPPQPSATPLSHQDSTRSSSGRWSATDFAPSSQPSSRPTSISSAASAPAAGFHSPGLDHKGFASDLPTHAETNEEHRAEALRKLDNSQLQPLTQQQLFQQQQQQGRGGYAYNPADYAKLPSQHVSGGGGGGGGVPNWGYNGQHQQRGH